MPSLFADSKALKQAREAAGFKSVHAAAKASGLSGRLIARVERASGRSIDLPALAQLANLYRCSPDQLTLSPLRNIDVEIDPDAVRARRKALGWSQIDLAAQVGMHFSAFVRWESQPPLRVFDHNRLRRMERALGIPEAQFTRPVKQEPV